MEEDFRELLAYPSHAQGPSFSLSQSPLHRVQAFENDLESIDQKLTAAGHSTLTTSW